MRNQLIENFKDGLLLLVKYGLLIAVVLYAFAFMNNTRQMAMNGEQAAILLVELQKKGYIPKIENGQIPDKPIVKAAEKQEEKK